MMKQRVHSSIHIDEEWWIPLDGSGVAGLVMGRYLKMLFNDQSSFSGTSSFSFPPSALMKLRATSRLWTRRAHEEVERQNNWETAARPLEFILE